MRLPSVCLFLYAIWMCGVTAEMVLFGAVRQAPPFPPSPPSPVRNTSNLQPVNNSSAEPTTNITGQARRLLGHARELQSQPPLHGGGGWVGGDGVLVDIVDDYPTEEDMPVYRLKPYTPPGQQDFNDVKYLNARTLRTTAPLLWTSADKGGFEYLSNPPKVKNIVTNENVLKPGTQARFGGPRLLQACRENDVFGVPCVVHADVVSRVCAAEIVWKKHAAWMPTASEQGMGDSGTRVVWERMLDTIFKWRTGTLFGAHMWGTTISEQKEEYWPYEGDFYRQYTNAPNDFPTNDETQKGVMCMLDNMPAEAWPQTPREQVFLQCLNLSVSNYNGYNGNSQIYVTALRAHLYCWAQCVFLFKLGRLDTNAYRFCEGPISSVNSDLKAQELQVTYFAGDDTLDNAGSSDLAFDGTALFTGEELRERLKYVQGLTPGTQKIFAESFEQNDKVLADLARLLRVTLVESDTNLRDTMAAQSLAMATLWRTQDASALFTRNYAALRRVITASVSLYRHTASLQALADIEGVVVPTSEQVVSLQFLVVGRRTRTCSSSGREGDTTDTSASPDNLAPRVVELVNATGYMADVLQVMHSGKPWASLAQHLEVTLFGSRCQEVFDGTAGRAFEESGSPEALAMLYLNRPAIFPCGIWTPDGDTAIERVYLVEGSASAAERDVSSGVGRLSLLHHLLVARGSLPSSNTGTLSIADASSLLPFAVDLPTNHTIFPPSENEDLLVWMRDTAPLRPGVTVLALDWPQNQAEAGREAPLTATTWVQLHDKVGDDVSVGAVVHGAVWPSDDSVGVVAHAALRPLRKLLYPRPSVFMSRDYQGGVPPQIPPGGWWLRTLPPINSDLFTEVLRVRVANSSLTKATQGSGFCGIHSTTESTEAERFLVCRVPLAWTVPATGSSLPVDHTLVSSGVEQVIDAIQPRIDLGTGGAGFVGNSPQLGVFLGGVGHTPTTVWVLLDSGKTHAWHIPQVLGSFSRAWLMSRFGGGGEVALRAALQNSTTENDVPGVVSDAYKGAGTAFHLSLSGAWGYTHEQGQNQVAFSRLMWVSGRDAAVGTRWAMCGLEKIHPTLMCVVCAAGSGGGAFSSTASPTTSPTVYSSQNTAPQPDMPLLSEHGCGTAGASDESERQKNANTMIPEHLQTVGWAHVAAVELPHNTSDDKKGSPVRIRICGVSVPPKRDVHCWLPGTELPVGGHNHTDVFPLAAEEEQVFSATDNSTTVEWVFGGPEVPSAQWLWHHVEVQPTFVCAFGSPPGVSSLRWACFGKGATRIVVGDDSHVPPAFRDWRQQLAIEEWQDKQQPLTRAVLDAVAMSGDWPTPIGPEAVNAETQRPSPRACLADTRTCTLTRYELEHGETRGFYNLTAREVHLPSGWPSCTLDPTSTTRDKTAEVPFRVPENAPAFFEFLASGRDPSQDTETVACRDAADTKASDAVGTSLSCPALLMQGVRAESPSAGQDPESPGYVLPFNGDWARYWSPRVSMRWRIQRTVFAYNQTVLWRIQTGETEVRLVFAPGTAVQQSGMSATLSQGPLSLRVRGLFIQALYDSLFVYGGELVNNNTVNAVSPSARSGGAWTPRRWQPLNTTLAAERARFRVVEEWEIVDHSVVCECGGLLQYIVQHLFEAFLGPSFGNSALVPPTNTATHNSKWVEFVWGRAAASDPVTFDGSLSKSSAARAAALHFFDGVKGHSRSVAESGTSVVLSGDTYAIFSIAGGATEGRRPRQTLAWPVRQDVRLWDVSSQFIANSANERITTETFELALRTLVQHVPENNDAGKNLGAVVNPEFSTAAGLLGKIFTSNRPIFPFVPETPSPEDIARNGGAVQTMARMLGPASLAINNTPGPKKNATRIPMPEYAETVFLEWLESDSDMLYDVQAAFYPAQFPECTDTTPKPCTYLDERFGRMWFLGMPNCEVNTTSGHGTHRSTVSEFPTPGGSTSSTEYSASSSRWKLPCASACSDLGAWFSRRLANATSAPDTMKRVWVLPLTEVEIQNSLYATPTTQVTDEIGRTKNGTVVPTVTVCGWSGRANAKAIGVIHTLDVAQALGSLEQLQSLARGIEATDLARVATAQKLVNDFAEIEQQIASVGVNNQTLGDTVASIEERRETDTNITANLRGAFLNLNELAQSGALLISYLGSDDVCGGHTSGDGIPSSCFWFAVIQSLGVIVLLHSLVQFFLFLRLAKINVNRDVDKFDGIGRVSPEWLVWAPFSSILLSVFGGHARVIKRGGHEFLKPAPCISEGSWWEMNFHMNLHKAIASLIVIVYVTVKIYIGLFTPSGTDLGVCNN
jgi:hypothetical protein